MTEVLRIQFQHQLASGWCWAAVSAMVASWYAQGNASPTQCAIASKTLGIPGCCGATIPDICNRLWSLDSALGVIGHFSGMQQNGGMNVVVGEIGNGRPVGALMRYWSGLSHYVLVTGYSQEQQLIVVCDPAGSSAFSTPAAVFFNNYNNGAVFAGWYLTQ